ncbi:MAG: DUF2808 domain-containing protein [Oscillatoriales cyanobacterium]|nr:MAG: DUF2808 domain-containing protein [Oscillatoriales cyanobacterium]TAH24459.1 MAG: DUF2808 domain-containing protein [Oscillatoriales cyanobacterium]
MKKLISTGAAFALILASSISAAEATGIPGDSKSPHIVGSRSYPDYPAWRAFHDFEVHVEGESISELSIQLPPLRIKGIEVSSQSGEKIEATTSVKGGKATVVFSKPVVAGTVLTISVLEVEASIYSTNYIYRVHAKKVGKSSQSEVGTANIQTLPRW